MIKHYTAFPKDTDCFSCAGCTRCESPEFTGVALCHSYRPCEVKNKFIDDICAKYTQERIGGDYREKSKD